MGASDLSKSDFPALLERAESKYAAWYLKELRPERDRRLNELKKQRLTSGGRAIYAFQIYRELLERAVRQRLDFYSAVARESSNSGMLAKPRLDEFRQLIMTSVGHEAATLKDHIIMNNRAAGDIPDTALPNENYYTHLESEILDVVNAELRVLEAEGSTAGILSDLSRQKESDDILPKGGNPHQGIVEGAMGDFLSELFDQFDQEEQARIRAAEASTTEMLAQGTAAAKGRRRVAESLHDNYWLLQPENDARIDSAGVVFVAYVNALWRKTDRARAECIHDFIAKVKELIEPILTTYGWLGKDLIAQLCEECQINAQYVRSMLPPSPEKTTSSTEDSAASSPQNGTDHASGHSEATNATEQSEKERGQSGDADRPVISIQPPAVLDFTDSWRKRMRLNADRSAQYARHLGRNGPEVEKQEDLLKDARVWAAATLRETVSEIQNVRELKERVVKQTWDQFVPKHRYYSDFRLGYREFESALWEEGWPSVEDWALEAVIERADSAGSQAGRAARQRPPLEAVAEDEERREKAKQNLVRALQSYINKLDNANARDAVRETEIFCDYARENYASRAEARLNAMPPMDPQELFEVGDLTERRDLTGLPTIGDVFELVKRVEVQRPEHWPGPIAYHPDDSLEMRGVLSDLTRRAHESFQWLLEEPWNAWFRPQIRECVTECVRATREEYELRLPISAVAGDPVGLAAIGSQGIGEGTIVNPFRQGAKEHPYLRARWDSRQKLWTLHDQPIDKQGKPEPHQTVLAGPEATRFFKEAARIAVGRLRQARDPEVRALAITLREPLYVWLDLMRTKERGFRRTPQLTSWGGGKSIEAFLESGAVPPDARLTENGSIGRLFEESAAFWDDLVDLRFDSDGLPTVAPTQSAASPARAASLKNRLRITSIDGSVRWINPEGSDPAESIWTPEDEKRISACVFDGRAVVRSELEGIFSGKEWPPLAALVEPFRRYAVAVFDVYASAYRHVARTVAAYQEALDQLLLPMVLRDLLGREWDRSPGEKVVRTLWQDGPDGKPEGREVAVVAGNDPDPTCVFYDLLSKAIEHRYRFFEPLAQPAPGEPPGISFPNLEWWRYIGLNERHNLAMAIKPYLEDRIAHWQFVYRPKASEKSTLAQASQAVVPSVPNATNSAALTSTDQAEIEQKLALWRDGISVDITMLLRWSGWLETTPPPKSMEFFRDLQPELRDRSFLSLSFNWEGSGTEILSHDQITDTLLKNLQRALKRYARQAIELISSKWADKGIRPEAFASRMESAGEAIKYEIFEMLEDGVSALAHGRSTGGLEQALSEQVRTEVARKNELYHRRAQLTGLCELPDAPAAEGTLAQLMTVTNKSEADWPNGVLGTAGLPTGRPTGRGFAPAPGLTPDGPGDAVPGGEKKGPKLNVALIKAWMDEEGWMNESLAQQLKISERAVSSMRNNGEYHGAEAVAKLANLMARDIVDLYLP